MGGSWVTARFFMIGIPHGVAAPGQKHCCKQNKLFV